jgi:hypothetical protein
MLLQQQNIHLLCADLIHQIHANHRGTLLVQQYTQHSSGWNLSAGSAYLNEKDETRQKIARRDVEKNRGEGIAPLSVWRPGERNP